MKNAQSNLCDQMSLQNASRSRRMLFIIWPCPTLLILKYKKRQLFSSVFYKSRYGRRRLVTEVFCLRNFSEELLSLAADNVTGSYVIHLVVDVGIFQNKTNYCGCSGQQWTSGQNMSNNKDLIDKLSLFLIFNRRTGMHFIYSLKT